MELAACNTLGIWLCEHLGCGALIGAQEEIQTTPVP